MAPIPQVNAPIPTFFTADEEIDFPTTKKHVQYLAAANVGIVAAGSMGEAVHLLFDERIALFKACREALDEAKATVPLIAGTGASSTKETIALTVGAAKAGCDYALVISPGYFAGALSKDALRNYFVEVAEASPIPILVYNYPAASAGIDLNTDDILAIAKRSKNVVGCKLTCGMVGKMSRLTALKNFIILGGFGDFLAPSMFLSPNIGCIIGTANIAPKTSRKVWDTTNAALTGSPALLSEAVRLQSILSEGDWLLAKGGISGTKALLDVTRGYGGLPRKPLLGYQGDVKELQSSLKELLESEASL